MNIGEEICGEWLRHVRGCEFVQYNLKPPGVQGEIDVIGINLAKHVVYVSEVANLTDVLELDRIGVTVVGVRESWLDTGGPVRSLLIAIFSWVAEQERARLVERTKAGLEQARRRGAKIGRPRTRFDVERARELRTEGRSLRAVAKELGVSYATLCRALAHDDEREGRTPVGPQLTANPSG